jgi:hypothetical protein
MGLHENAYLIRKLKGAVILICTISNRNDAPPNSLLNSTTSLHVKTMEGQGIGARFLTCSTSGEKGHVGAPRWGLGRVTRKSIIYMDWHKPNNKLVSA